MAPMLYVAAVQRGARKPTPPFDEIAGLQRKVLKLEREVAVREGGSEGGDLGRRSSAGSDDCPPYMRGGRWVGRQVRG